MRFVLLAVQRRQSKINYEYLGLIQPTEQVAGCLALPGGSVLPVRGGGPAPLANEGPTPLPLPEVVVGRAGEE